MTARRRIAFALLAPALIFAAPAACARGAGPTAAPASSGSAVSAPAAPTATPTTAPGQPTTPATTVVLNRVAYRWHWPNDVAEPARVTHPYPVPPVPQLIRVGAGTHPADPGERPFDRMSFTFTTAFPTYEVAFVDRLAADGSGRPIPLEGTGILRIVFRQAQAHGDSGADSVLFTPPAHLGYPRMSSYARAGDFEGVVTYGIGISWPVGKSNPLIPVRAYEIEQLSLTGQHLYVVAIDVDATMM
jgi:hypothetical protein